MGKLSLTDMRNPVPALIREIWRSLCLNKENRGGLGPFRSQRAVACYQRLRPPPRAFSGFRLSSHGGASGAASAT
jgi:hypothetical protein